MKKKIYPKHTDCRFCIGGTCQCPDLARTTKEGLTFSVRILKDANADASYCEHFEPKSAE